MKYCVHCGNEIHDDAVICVKCGRNVESSKPAAVQAAGGKACRPEDSRHTAHSL